MNTRHEYTFIHSQKCGKLTQNMATVKYIFEFELRAWCKSVLPFSVVKINISLYFTLKTLQLEIKTVTAVCAC